ncbi:MAG: hypothetical protein ABIV94_12100 [Acidimicrobiales bacterium]
MAAPEFVPTKPTDEVRVYASPPRRPESWLAKRPGDLGGDEQPRGDQLGNQGPDQGFVLRLVRSFADKLHLGPDERIADVNVGAVAVALKRASLFGRAPVVHDLTAAYTVWGYLDDVPAPALVALRSELFAGVAHPHHYTELRRVADSVAEATLRLTPEQVAERHRADWRALLAPTAAPPPH